MKYKPIFINLVFVLFLWSVFYFGMYKLKINNEYLRLYYYLPYILILIVVFAQSYIEDKFMHKQEKRCKPK